VRDVEFPGPKQRFKGFECRTHFRFFFALAGSICLPPLEDQARR
jgi:hypothetical protein